MCSQYFPGFQRFYLFWVCYISNLAASRRLWWVSIAAPWSLEAWLCRGNLGAWIIECLPPSFIGGYWSIINNNKMQKGYQYHNFSWILPKRSFSGCSLRIVINHQPPRYLCHQHSELHIWRNWLVKNSLILNFFATSGKVHWQPSVQEGLGCSAAHQRLNRHPSDGSPEPHEDIIEMSPGPTQHKMGSTSHTEAIKIIHNLGQLMWQSIIMESMAHL